jgi:hypothetical protein
MSFRAVNRGFAVRLAARIPEWRRGMIQGSALATNPAIVAKLASLHRGWRPATWQEPEWGGVMRQELAHEGAKPELRPGSRPLGINDFSQVLTS